MKSNNINLVHVSLEDMTNIMREIVATELQKVRSLFTENPKNDSDKFLTRLEVCKLLSVSTTTLYNWNKSKILVHQKINRKVFYMLSDVLALLNPLKAVS